MSVNASGLAVAVPSGELALALTEIYFSYPKRDVLTGVSLAVSPGAILCLLGPSGCGKTTLLRIVAGLNIPKRGRVTIRGKDMTNAPPRKRGIGFVFQSDNALFTHLNVFDNVAFAFRHGHKAEKGENWRATTNTILHDTGLDNHRYESIARLSGGLKQRVGLARAIVYKPSLLLLDEPLTSLDNPRKDDLLDLLQRLHAKYHTTFVYVTHDEREALRFSTHLAILSEGRIQQFGPTLDVFKRPTTEAVARILGDWNIVVCEQSTERSEIDRLGLGAFLSIASGGVAARLPRTWGFPVSHTRLGTGEAICPEGHIAVPVTIVSTHPWRDGHRYVCRLSNGCSLRASSATNTLPIGVTAYLTIEKEHVHAF